jgi:hypothetical protein
MDYAVGIVKSAIVLDVNRSRPQRGRRPAGHIRVVTWHRVRVVRLLSVRITGGDHQPPVLFRANPTAAFIFALLAFAAGFVVRPFGALVFGRLGDLVGRKYTFLLTMSSWACRRVSSGCCRPTRRLASSRLSC